MVKVTYVFGDDRCHCCGSTLEDFKASHWPQCKACELHCPNYAAECQREQLTKRAREAAR